MKLLDYNMVLRDFSYKPNFRYSAYEREPGEWWIRVLMFVENSREPLKLWDPQPHPASREMSFINDYDYQRVRMPEYYSPERPVIEVMGNYPIPYFGVGDDLPFITWMVYTIKSIEEHEQDEWIRYKGELIRDPHAND